MTNSTDVKLVYLTHASFQKYEVRVGDEPVNIKANPLCDGPKLEFERESWYTCGVTGRYIFVT